MPTVPASPPTTSTIQPVPQPTQWNKYFTLSASFTAAWAIYVVVVSGRMTHGEIAEAVPRSLNAIVLTGLSLLVLGTLILGCRYERRLADMEWQTAILGKIEELQRAIAAQQQPDGGRRDDETTVNLSGGRAAYRPEAHVVYTSAAWRGADSHVTIDGAADRVVNRIEAALDARDKRIATRLDEMDERLHDFALLAQGQQGLNGSVRRLPNAR